MNSKTLSIVLMLPLMIFVSKAESALILLQEMALHSMLESTASVLTTLSDYAVSNPDGISNGTANIGGGGISWTGSYGDSGWSYSGNGSFGGMLLSMSYAGTLSGADGTDITVTIAGTGMLGNQPLLMNASTKWAYDATLDDYLAMDFAQETKVGAASYWGWVVGGEKVICIKADAGSGNGVVRGGVIAGNDIVLSSIASLGKRTAFGSGIKFCFSPIGVAGEFLLSSVASTGKKGGMTVSSVTKSALNNIQHVAPALPPPFSDLLSPANQGTLVADDGGLYADDMFNRFRSTGSYVGDTLGGTFSGITSSVVPEPAIGWLVMAGVLGLMGTRKRKSK